MFALALSLALGAPAVGGHVDVNTLTEPASIDGAWLFSADDDLAWAAPGFDDASWRTVTVPKGLGAQGYQDLVGPYWLRVHVRAPRPASTDQIAVQIQDVDSAYEIYADGVRIGGRGSVLAPQIDDDAHPGIWRLPRDALDDGEVVLAIRGYRSALRRSSNPARGGVVHGPNRIGETDALARSTVTRDLDKWFLGGCFFVVGLYHLQLFRRRRALLEYLWFGVFSLAMAAYVLSEIRIVAEVLDRVGNGQLWFGFVSLGVFSFTKFILPFLGRSAHRGWRAWQVLALAWGAVAVAWPTQWFTHWSLQAWELFVLTPLLVGTVVIVGRGALRGDPEARTIAFGAGLMVVTSVNNIARSFGLQTPEITNYAFAGFVLSMAVSLSDRFTRVYREHDELLAETLRLGKLKDEFLANTSHELRTPLNAIINVPHGLLAQFEERRVVACTNCGAAFERDDDGGGGDDVGDAALGGTPCPACGATKLAVSMRRFAPDDADALEHHLRTIIGSGEHLLAVVNDILDSSKLATGTLELHRERVALAAVVDTALRTVEPLATAAGVALVTRIDPALQVSVDTVRFAQVVMNLATNAVKFSARGAAVELEGARVDGGVALRVIDRGPGIAPEHHALIFESFRQIEGGHTRKHGGTGLGLAIVKQLVELHGGTVAVASSLGAGAVFTVTLPDR